MFAKQFSSDKPLLFRSFFYIFNQMSNFLAPYLYAVCRFESRRITGQAFFRLLRTCTQNCRAPSSRGACCDRWFRVISGTKPRVGYPLLVSLHVFPVLLHLDRLLKKNWTATVVFDDKRRRFLIHVYSAVWKLGPHGLSPSTVYTVVRKEVIGSSVF